MASIKKLFATMQFSKEQGSELVSSSSIFVKCLWSLMIIGYLLSFSETAFHNTAIIVGEILPPNFKLWTSVVYVFVEKHIWMLLCNLVVVFLYGRLLQPLWGILEICRFIAMNTFVPATFAIVLYMILFFNSEHYEYMFEYHIYGFSASVAGFCVAVKQAMPDQVLFNFSVGKMQNKHIPLLLFFLAFFANLVGLVELTYPVLYFFGLITSWIYLRFYQKHGNGNQGDRAEKFSFASFFPLMIQPVIQVPSKLIHSCLVKVKICKKSPELLHFQFESKSKTVLLPGIGADVAERQRQLAMKALNERLVKTPVVGMIQVPSKHVSLNIDDEQTTSEHKSTT